MHSLVSQVKAETLNCLVFLCTVKWIGSPKLFGECELCSSFGAKFLNSPFTVSALQPTWAWLLCTAHWTFPHVQFGKPQVFFFYFHVYLWRNAYSCVYTYITVLSWFPDVVCQLSALEPSFPAKACSYAVIAKAVTPQPLWALWALVCGVFF